MGDLSTHFDRREFRCRHCGRLPAGGVEWDLVVKLEHLRELVGRPLRIVSGYRCATHNRAIGGARRSRHVNGDAADIPTGYATVHLARQAGFTGIGVRGGWVVHVDTRPGQRVVFKD